MEHVTQRRFTALLGVVVASLVLLAVIALPAPALTPAGQSQTTPSKSQTSFEQTAVSSDAGPLGGSRVGVIGRNRVPETDPSSTATVIVVVGLLASALVVIALATAVVDRRRARQLAELGPPARFPLVEEQESRRRTAA